MIRSLAQISTIARNTFIESIRQPIFSVLTLVAILALVLNPAISGYTMDDDNKIMVDMGLSTLFLAGLLLAAFTATGVLSQEVENKTVLTVVSKPVARPVFVVGKYLGVLTALLVSYWVLSSIFLLSVRHGVMQTAAESHDEPVLFFGIAAGLLALAIATLGNYFYHWVFTSSFMLCLFIAESVALFFIAFINKNWAFQRFDIGSPQLLLGMLLILMGLAIVTAVAIAASTRLGQIMTLMICLGAYLLGMVADFMYSKAPHNAAWNLMYKLTPNMQMFWPADQIAQKTPFTGHYMIWTAMYALSYVGALLGVAIVLFQTREVG